MLLASYFHWIFLIIEILVKASKLNHSNKEKLLSECFQSEERKNYMSILIYELQSTLRRFSDSGTRRWWPRSHCPFNLFTPSSRQSAYLIIIIKVIIIIIILLIYFIYSQPFKVYIDSGQHISYSVNGRTYRGVSSLGRGPEPYRFASVSSVQIQKLIEVVN
jgi:hypothetical protein